MAIEFVQKSSHTESNGTTNPVDVTLTGVTAGSCLVLVGSIYNSSDSYTISGVSDGAAYTVRSGTHTTFGIRQYSVVAYLLNASSGTHTASITLSGATANQTYAVFGLAEFSGVATSSAEDTWDANDSISITASDISAGPITTTDAGALLIGTAEMIADSATSLAWASPTSWTNLYRQNDAYTSGTGHDSGYWLPGSTQSNYTAQWSHRNITDEQGSGVVVALLPATGGPSFQSAWARNSNQVIQ
jgi:hypothetical protein